MLDFRTRRRIIGRWKGNMLRTEVEYRCSCARSSFWWTFFSRHDFSSSHRPWLSRIQDRRKYAKRNDAPYLQAVFNLSRWCRFTGKRKRVKEKNHISHWRYVSYQLYKVITQLIHWKEISKTVLDWAQEGLGKIAIQFASKTIAIAVLVFDLQACYSHCWC